MTPKKPTFFPRMRVRYIPVDRISDSRCARKWDNGLDDLVFSVEHWGILVPLIVRPVPGGFEPVCGGRRLAAARACGLVRVPCIVVKCSEEDADTLRTIENHQRRQPDIWTEAEELKNLLRVQKLTVADAAQLAGLTFDDAVEKLRCLELGERLLQGIAAGGLAQSHASALLRLSDERTRETALCEMAYRRIPESGAHAYIDALLSHGEPGDE